MQIGPFSSVAQSCPTLRDPMDCSTPGPPSITNSRSLFKLMSIELVMSSNHLILCRPLLLPPSIFPSIRVFSNTQQLIWQMLKWCLIQTHHRLGEMIIQTRLWVPGCLYILAGDHRQVTRALCASVSSSGRWGQY